MGASSKHIFSAEHKPSGMKNSNKRRVNILHIEDNPADFNLVQAYLKDSSTFDFNFISVSRLGEAFEADTVGVDLILLDLYLPDSVGPETVEKVCFTFPDIPVIVTTGLKDEEVGMKAIRTGAQDYLVKGDDYHRLNQAIDYAIERHMKEKETLEAVREEYYQNELDILGNTVEINIKEGSIKLDKQCPEVFQELCSRFTHVVEYYPSNSLNRPKSGTSKLLKKITDDIGALGGGTKDIFKIYITAIKEKAQTASALEQEVFMQRAHLLMLEMMGHLINYYQDKINQKKYKPDGEDY